MRSTQPRWSTVGLALLLAACGSSAANGGAQANGEATESTEPASNAKQREAKVRKAIESFLNAPQKGADARAIVNFVGESPDVMVVYRESLLSAEGSTKDIDQLMLAAFAAGNVLAQLDAGRKEDMPVAGVRALLTAYSKLKAQDPALKIAKFEEYATHEAKGTLEAHVKELAK